MASGGSQPFSSCAMASADITADCFWSGGYLATSRSIRESAAALSTSALRHLHDSPRSAPDAVSRWGGKRLGAARRRSSVNLPEHDVQRADDGDRIGDHVA